MMIGLNMADTKEYPVNRKYHLMVFDSNQMRITGSFPMSNQADQDSTTLSISSAVKRDEDGKVSLLIINAERNKTNLKLTKEITRVKVYIIQNMTLWFNKTMFQDIIPTQEEVNKNKNSLQYNKSLEKKILKILDPDCYRLVSYAFDNSTSQNISMKILMEFGDEDVSVGEKRLIKIMLWTALVFSSATYIACCLYTYQTGIKDKVIEAIHEEEAHLAYRRMLRNKKRYNFRGRRKIYTSML